MRSGRAAEAVEPLQAAIAVDGADPDARRRLARALQARGDLPAEIEAWRALLVLDPAHVEAHARLSKIHLKLESPAEAIPHLAFLAEASPTDIDGWRRLARCRRAVGESVGELAAWQKLLALDPGDIQAHQRVVDLALSHEPGQAARSLRALAEAWPDDIARWTRLARCLGRMGDVEDEAQAWRRVLAAPTKRGREPYACLLRAARRLSALGDPNAAEAWRRTLAYDPLRTEAHARLAEMALYGHGDAGNADATAPAIVRGIRPRVLVVGNCQAYGLGARLRASCPSAEIRTVGFAEAESVEDADALAGQWDRLDYVITQFTDLPEYGELRSSRLERRAGRLIYFPRIHFRGFQPDLLRAGARPLGPFPVKGFHSAIVMAAYGLNIPERQVPDLFNAYVFGVLGYFDEYAKAELYHLADARRWGIELEPLLADWRKHGAFVHVPNHPVLRVFQSFADMLAGELGLETAPEAETPSDDLEGFGVWPVYPEIGARLGVKGSLRFRLGRGMAAMQLDELVARSYRAYAALDPEQIRQSARETIEALRAEGL
jgi:tetratricopeptide (TPR) repeat protein